MLKISPLFSGSKGNCTLISSPCVNLLLDAGYTFRATVQALEKRGLQPTDINAIVVTHEHIDHIGALPQWSKRFPTPVFAPAPIVDTVSRHMSCGEAHAVEGCFSVGDVDIEPYECFHDAICCFGYKFKSDQSRFACVTDTGHADDKLLKLLWDCPAVMLESNHDPDMLANGSYSYVLKRRIASPYGHLSNAQTAEILQKLADSCVRTVILAHLSENNNNKELAFDSAVKAFASCGKAEGKDVAVYVADQRNNEVTVYID